MDSTKYDVKKFIIDNKIDKKLNKIKKNMYIYSNIYNTYFDTRELFDTAYADMIDLVKKYGSDIVHSAGNLLDSKKHKRSRVKKYITAMLEHGTCLFLTLTFDSVRLGMSYDNRRRMVREFLKSYSDYYIANIDFGDNNGREHYHAVILLDNIDLKSWRGGFMFANRIYNKSDDIERISTYINKLTSHALKKSTGNSFPLIYSKKLKDLL